LIEQSEGNGMSMLGLEVSSIAHRAEQLRRHTHRALGAFATTGLGLLALAGPAAADATLGVLVPASGRAASYGQQQQSAIEMFMERYADLGSAGKLKLITYDTRGENTEAINLTRKLIATDNVLAVVGPQFSAEAEVAFPLGVRGETVILTPMAAKPGIAGANRPWAFRFALTSENDYRPLLEAWLKRQATPIRKVVILHDAKDAVSSFDGKTVFPMLLKEQGVEVVETVTFQTGDIDYSAQVTKAKAASPDGIVVSALYNEAAHTTRELRKQGMNQPIVAGVGVNDPRFIQLAGGAAEGVMAAFDFFAQNPDPAVAAWATEFERRFKVQPSNAAALMYDSLFLMRDCIMRLNLAGGDLKAERVKLRDCWANMKDRTAPLTGATSIDKNGDAVRKPVILVAKGDRFVAAP
jgi:branched-chain amino acid transport system substrate-binding protein